MSHRALQRANLQVAEQEHLVTEWVDLIGRMHAEGRDVTLAMELLDVFRTYLATYRANRDRLKHSLRDDSDADQSRSTHERVEVGLLHAVPNGEPPSNFVVL
jgi:hypothetical protein